MIKKPIQHLKEFKESKIIEELNRYKLEDIPCRFIENDDPCKDISKYFDRKLTKTKFPIIFELVSTELNNIIRYQSVIKIHMSVLDIYAQEYFPEFQIDLLFGNWKDLYRNSSRFWIENLEPIFEFLTSTSLKIKSTSEIIEETLAAFTKIDRYFEPHFKFHIHSPQYLKYCREMEELYPEFQDVITWCNNQDIFIRLFNKITMENLFMFSRLNFGTVGTLFETLERKFSIVRGSLIHGLTYNDMRKTLQRAKLQIRIEDMLKKLRQIEILFIGYNKSDFPNSECLKMLPIEPFQITNRLFTKPEFPNEIRALISHATAHLFTPDKKRFLVKLLLFTDILIIAKIMKKLTPIKLKIFRAISLDRLYCYDNDKENSFNLFENKPFQHLRECFCIAFNKSFQHKELFMNNIEIVQRNSMKILQLNQQRNEAKLKLEDSNHPIYKYRCMSANPRHSLDTWLDDCVDTSPYFNGRYLEEVIQPNFKIITSLQSDG